MSGAPTVAALYVDPNGVYAGLPSVEVWDEARDARTYAGPWPVVAHPPCARWSRLASFVQARWGYKKGDDGGCFAAALASVREFGGVIEHPAYSDAWAAFGLPRPTVREGWTLNLDGEASCYVEQGRYGLPVKKATWLYAVGVELPELRWGFTPDCRGERKNEPWGGSDGWRDAHSVADWLALFGGRSGDYMDGDHPTHKKGLTSVTPPAFRDVLLAMARSAAGAVDE
jgi:hypothetical protein